MQYNKKSKLKFTASGLSSDFLYFYTNNFSCFVSIQIAYTYLKSVPALSAAAMDEAYQAQLFSAPLPAQTLPKAYRPQEVFRVQAPQPLKNTVQQNPYHVG